MILIDQGRPVGIAPAKEPHIRCGCGGPPGLCEDLYGGLVNIDQSPFQNLVFNEVEHGQAGVSRSHRPVAHGCPAEIHPEAGKKLLLPVKGEMINELGSQHMGQQPRTGDGPGNDLWRNRCDPHGRAVIIHSFALTAGILGADMAQDLDASRNDIQLLGCFFADPTQFTPAGANLLLVCKVMQDLNPRQVCGQRPATGLLAAMALNHNLGWLDIFRLGQVEQRDLHHG